MLHDNSTKTRGSKELSESVLTCWDEELLNHLPVTWRGGCLSTVLWVPPPSVFGGRVLLFSKRRNKNFCSLPLLAWDACPFYLNMPFVSFSKVFPEENLAWTPGISSIIVLLQGASPGSFVHGLKGQSTNRPLLCAFTGCRCGGRESSINMMFCWRISFSRKVNIYRLYRQKINSH